MKALIIDGAISCGHCHKATPLKLDGPLSRIDGIKYICQDCGTTVEVKIDTYNDVPIISDARIQYIANMLGAIVNATEDLGVNLSIGTDMTLGKAKAKLVIIMNKETLKASFSDSEIMTDGDKIYVRFNNQVAFMAYTDI